MERQNFCRRTQQPGESFDDYLVSLRELVKTCNFCNDACTQKSVRDQIIKGLLDGDTVEHLLQEKDLSLDRVISVCQVQEAAKKQRAAIQQGSSHLNESVAALPQKKVFTPQALCPGCGAQPHPAGRTQCPAYHVSCHNCKKLGHFARVCCSRPVQPSENKPPRPCTATLQSDIPLSQDAGLSNIHHVTSTNPAPKLQMDIITLNCAVTTAVLPDSGAYISAAGTGIPFQLIEHIDDLLPSSVIPKAAHGAEMHPVGRLPVCFKIGNKKHLDDLHIYPNVTGTLMSWNTCKELGILPDCYPNPTITSITVSSIANTTTIPPSPRSSLDRHTLSSSGVPHCI